MKKFALLGYEIDYSLSPLIHKTVFADLKVDADYILVSLTKEELAKNTEFFCSLDGFNVTKPHKQNILPFLAGNKLDSVNTVKTKDGKLFGYSTDADGFCADIKRLFGGADGKALVLGAGGAASAVTDGLKALGAEVYILNRTPEKAELMAQKKKVKVFKNDFAPDFIINCTSYGFNKGENPMPYADLSRLKWTYDTIYSPRTTEFMESSSKSGAKTANGLGMLIFQAFKADEIFLSTEIDEHRANRLFTEIMEKIG